MDIKIEDLESVTKKLYSHLRDLNLESVELSEDYYWQIAREQRYDPTTKPTNFDLGQLSDDWSELQRLLLGHRNPLGVDLITLAVILRFIGENVLG